MKWFYKVLDLGANTSKWQAQLDELGRGGWELVQIVEAAISTQAVFKKPEQTVLSRWGTRTDA